MGSDTRIGNVDQYLLVTGDSLQNEYKTNLSKSFAVNPEATYGQVDNASRQITALSTNGYKDTILVTNISVNEVMAG